MHLYLLHIENTISRSRIFKVSMCLLEHFILLLDLNSLWNTFTCATDEMEEKPTSKNKTKTISQTEGFGS